MPNDLTDSALIAASWSDPDRFSGIFERHFPAVYGFVVRAVGSADGPDLAAEAFARAFAIRRRYDLSYDNARPWLFGIAANLIAGHLRRQARESKALRRHGAGERQVEEFETQAASRVDATAAAGQLQRALRALRREEVAVVSLFVLEDLSYTEIAAALAIPEGTVRSRLSRARAKLRNLMADGGEVPRT